MQYNCIETCKRVIDDDGDRQRYFNSYPGGDVESNSIKECLDIDELPSNELHGLSEYPLMNIKDGIDFIISMNEDEEFKEFKNIPDVNVILPVKRTGYNLNLDTSTVAYLPKDIELDRLFSYNTKAGHTYYCNEHGYDELNISFGYGLILTNSLITDLKESLRDSIRLIAGTLHEINI